MKKVLLLLLLLVGITANAQQDVGGFLHVGIGTSISSGDFGATNANNPAAGFANNGLMLHALLGHKIHKQFGAFVSMNFSVNPVNEAALSKALNSGPNSYSWAVKANSWSLVGFMFGPQFSQNFKKTAFDFRVALGALNFISPQLTYSGTSLNGSDVLNIVTKEKKASAFAIGAGMTFKYEFKWSWVALINADYYQANPVFNQVEKVTKQTGKPDQTTYIQFQQAFRIYQLSLGIGYVF
ncbi:MAG: hypothetical protein GC180_03015 [Bacteroidetes bacterium]|nr:hypothetical protein [Bacteroidota bacterium]